VADVHEDRVINRVGQVWKTSNECVYLIVDWCILPQAAVPGVVWVMRSLDEHAPFPSFGRIVQMHDKYLTENLYPLSEPSDSVLKAQ
jgi:hypothetical protein